MDFLPSVFQENNKERKHCTRTDRAESEQNCSLQLAAFIFRRIHLKEANSHNAGGGSTTEKIGEVLVAAGKPEN